MVCPFLIVTTSAGEGTPAGDQHAALEKDPDTTLTLLTAREFEVIMVTSIKINSDFKRENLCVLMKFILLKMVIEDEV